MSRAAFIPVLDHLGGGGTFDEDQAAEIFGLILSGRVAEDDLADFLLMLAERQPTVAEITGAARVMRANMTRIEAPQGAIDLCGTGGDGHETVNVSTAASFVVAGCGVPVAKHGNRSATSRSGAADVLEQLGVPIDLSPSQSEARLRDTGLCFLFAQIYHPAMRHVAEVRRQIGVRTIFNLLGPISSPANVKRQLVGVYSKEWTGPLAHVLAALGAEKAWVVHGSDGLDELSTTRFTHIAALERGQVAMGTVSPADAGLAQATLADLKGGDAGANADAIRRLLDGEAGPFRDIVLLNAAAALIVAGKAASLRDGAALAADCIDTGRARAILAKLAS
jgi:anthranilate phosphoribosyltransferase